MNREIAASGQGIYPLAGDVTSTAGNSTVTVTGVQTIPVAGTFPLGGSVMTYNPATHNWEPIVRACIQVNNLSVSDDYNIAINVPHGISLNGTGIG